MLSNKHKPIFSMLVLISFFFVLLAPLMTELLGIRSVQHAAENRDRGSRPPEISASDLASFPQEFDHWYQDAFGFRDVFIALHDRFNLILGVSPSHRVVKGKSGWLFNTDHQAVDKVLGLKPFSNWQLVQESRYLEAKRDWLADFGIDYLYVIAPDKHSVYPEYLPARLPTATPPGRLKQLTDYLEANSDVTIVNLHPALMTAKGEQQVYYALDTHWNGPGAFAAYQEISRHLASVLPGFQTLLTEYFTWIEQTAPRGDLATLFGFDDGFREQETVLIPKNPICARSTKPRIKIDSSVSDGIESAATACRNSGNLPEGLLFRDSFGISLLPFLREHFSHLEHINSPFSPFYMHSILQQQPPAIVIEESVERLMSRKTRLYELNRYRFQDSFESLAQLFSLNPLQPRTDFGKTHLLNISPTNGSAVFDLLAPGGFADIGPLHMKRDHRAVIHIRIESPGDTTMRIGYRTIERPEFGRNRPYRVPLKQGSNDIFVEIQDKSRLNAIRLTPGLEKGRYLISRLEIRMRQYGPPDPDLSLRSERLPDQGYEVL